MFNVHFALIRVHIENNRLTSLPLLPANLSSYGYGYMAMAFIKCTQEMYIENVHRHFHVIVLFLSASSISLVLF